MKVGAEELKLIHQHLPTVAKSLLFPPERHADPLHQNGEHQGEKQPFEALGDARQQPGYGTRLCNRSSGITRLHRAQACSPAHGLDYRLKVIRHGRILAVVRQRDTDFPELTAFQ